jgi:hypothetical protein
MKKTSLVLRSCRADLTSTNNFQWPQVGGVAEAPDWKSDEECGNGLHGWLYGQGDYSCSNFLSDGCKWLVVEVESDQIVMLGGKCKFPRGTVRFIGERHEAAAYIIEHEERSANVAVIGAVRSVGERQVALVGDYGTATAGYKGTATAGDEGTATAGDEGTATAGYKGTATAGDEGTATAGYKGTATAGDYGTATAGNYGTATAGYKGTATAGNYGTATAGNKGTATAGYKGTATAGDEGTATAGDYGTATAGEGGVICIRYYDSNRGSYRMKVGEIGENGLLPNVAYRLDDKDQFVEVAKQEEAA